MEADAVGPTAYTVGTPEATGPTIVAHHRGPFAGVKGRVMVTE